MAADDVSAMRESPEWLAALAAELAALPQTTLWVGFSGGLDSTVLLHALASLPQARERGLRALHVDHGSGGHSAHWARHCRAFASRLGIEAQVVRANVRDVAKHGLEGAWRRARHEAFAEALPENSLLALAQHRDDQVETLLLRLLHSAGHEGLAAMRKIRPLRSRDSTRWLWRPLLDVPRSRLREYAQMHGLDCIDDPANHDPRHARTRLRTRVLPALRDAFPDADARIAAAATRLREEADALHEVARQFIQTHRDANDASLPARELVRLPNALRREAVSRWLDELGLPRPPAATWSRIVPELIEAAPDADACLRWNGAQLRRYRDRVFALAPFDESPTFTLDWDGCAPLRLPQGLGTLHIEPAPSEPQRWQVRNREGGERLRLGGMHRSLKHLMQQAALPPWRRGRVPLLFDTRGELLAAGEMIGDGLQSWLAARQARLIYRE